MQADRTSTPIEWAVGLAAILENRPDAKSLTVELEPAGRVHVTRDRAVLILRGETYDLNDMLGEEAFEVTALGRGVDFELEFIGCR